MDATLGVPLPHGAFVSLDTLLELEMGPSQPFAVTPARSIWTWDNQINLGPREPPFFVEPIEQPLEWIKSRRRYARNQQRDEIAEPLLEARTEYSEVLWWCCGNLT